MKRVGISSPVDLAPTREFVPGRGYVTTRHIQGLRTELEGYMQGLMGSEIRHRLEPIEGTPIADLYWEVNSVDDGSNQDEEALSVSSEWELNPQDIELDIRQHPKALAVDAAFPGVLAAVKKAADDFSSSASIGDDLPELVTVGNATFDGYLSAILELFLNAGNKYLSDALVLVHTINVNRGSALKADLSNVLKIFTTEQLQSSENIPATVLFSLPSGFWLKKRPQVRSSSNGTAQIVYTWIHAESYSSFLYDAATI